MRTHLTLLLSALALPALALPTRAEGKLVAARVTRRADVLEGPGASAPRLGVAFPDQLYVVHPDEAGGQRERIRFSERPGWIERAALEPLPDAPLYMVAADPLLRVGTGHLENGSVVAPSKWQGEWALIHFAGQPVWIPRSALRGPVHLDRFPLDPLEPTTAGRSVAGERTAAGPQPKVDAVAPALASPGASSPGALASPGATVTPAIPAPSTTAALAGGPEVETPAPVVAPRGNGRVNYQGRVVSSAAVRDFLQRLADLTGRTVRVTSGDRNHVPAGGSRTSLHLAHRAADFVVDGLTLGATFELIRANRQHLTAGRSFEVIWHQPGTETSGPHLHAGDYGDARGTVFKTETRGVYRRVN